MDNLLGHTRFLMLLVTIICHQTWQFVLHLPHCGSVVFVNISAKHLPLSLLSPWPMIVNAYLFLRPYNNVAA